jgi:DNA-binding CsgD family transcriptional regulator
MRHLATPLTLSMLLIFSFLHCSCFGMKATTEVKQETALVIKSVQNNTTTWKASSNSLGAITALNNAEIHDPYLNTVSKAPNLFFEGLFYGFTLMIILLNIVCYFIFNDKNYGYFGISILASVCLFFTADGLLSEFISSTGKITTALSTSFVCITFGLSALFSAKYLLIRDHFPKLRAFTIPLFILALAMASIAWLTDNTTFTVASNLLSFAVVCSYFGAGVLLFPKKNYAKFYVISFSIPLLFAMDYFLLNPLGIKFLETTTSHIKIALLAEMIIMTYAILYRMKAIKEELLIQKTEMQIFLKRQETLNRDSLARMMEDVYLENLIMHYDLDGVEIKLLQYISEGKENNKIARKLNTTETEIEELTKELYHKLEINEAVNDDFKMLENQPDFIYN